MAGKRVEGPVQHHQNVRRLVVDDPSRLRVPEDRNRDPAVERRVARGVGLRQEIPAVERIPRRAANLPKRPAPRVAERVDDRHPDRVLEALQPPQDHRPVGPRAGERHVEVIAPRHGGKPRAPVRCDPVPEPARLTHEATRRRARRLPMSAHSQQAHSRPPTPLAARAWRADMPPSPTGASAPAARPGRPPHPRAPPPAGTPPARAGAASPRASLCRDPRRSAHSRTQRAPPAGGARSPHLKSAGAHAAGGYPTWL